MSFLMLVCWKQEMNYNFMNFKIPGITKLYEKVWNLHF